jgi:inorganic pyrophosphatase
MMDNGKLDEKIIAIPFSDPTYNGYRSIFALPRHVYEEMRHFFTVYKHLEQKETVVDEVGDENTAVEIIRAAIEQYSRDFADLPPSK